MTMAMESISMSKKSRVICELVVLAFLFQLQSVVISVDGQQIPRPGGSGGGVAIAPATPTPAQAVAAAQYYANAVSQSPPKPIPAPNQQGPTQQQLQQQYILQQQRQKQAQQQAADQRRHQQEQQQRQEQRQEQQQPRIIYQPKVVQGPPKSNQLRAQQPSRGPPSRQQPQQQQQQQQGGNSQESYEYEEEEEPDRLTQLLLNSKFQCSGKKDGYYADESLACEVFHYCHDSVKHSWMCPNQFMFHQVHLICVPPSSENICKQSSSFHFVNEYLYRPINVKEVERNQNVSLRYGDRYYPEGYAVGLTPFDDQYLLGESGNRATFAPAPSHVQSQHDQRRDQDPRHDPRQQTQQLRGKVYYSADSVNIPLSQRRPTASSPVAIASSRQPPAASHSHSEEEYDYE